MLFNSKIYCDVHRAFVQIMLDRGFLYSKDAIAAFIDLNNDYGFELFEQDENSERTTTSQQPVPNIKKIAALKLHESLSEINQRIKPMNIEIKQSYCELTGKQMLALVNRLDSPKTILFMSEFTPLEMEYFKKVLKLIMDSTNCFADLVDCLNLRSQIEKSMSQSEASTFLDTLKRQNWLVEQRGMITLHSRAVTELQPLLVEEFGVETCPTCQSPVLISKDQTCAKCNGKSHKYCVERFARIRQMPAKCLHENCQAPWMVACEVPLLSSSQQQQGSAKRTASQSGYTDGAASIRRRNVIIDTDD